MTPWKIRKRVRNLVGSTLESGLERVRAFRSRPQPRRQQAANAKPSAIESEAVRQPVDPKFLEVLDKGSFSERLQAVKALAAVGGEAVRRPLEEALSDSAAEVAMAAADALVELGARESEEALAKVLTDPNGYYAPVTRAKAATALRRLLAHEAVNHLVLAIDDNNADVSGTAIAVLGELGDIRAREPLLRVMQKPDFYVPDNRRLALLALARLGLSQAELKSLAENDPDPSVRAAIPRDE